MVFAFDYYGSLSRSFGFICTIKSQLFHYVHGSHVELLASSSMRKWSPVAGACCCTVASKDVYGVSSLGLGQLVREKENGMFGGASVAL